MSASHRAGPAPIASFDHDASDESSPESKLTFQLPEIREDLSAGTAGAPRIDISRASSSSVHDSRDSSPEAASALVAGFREEGAEDLRSSTEELHFLEGQAQTQAAPVRRHSRKESQGSEAASLAVMGRGSRVGSVGSAASATSAGRLSVGSVRSAVSRSPSPHKMLLETSFCGPKPLGLEPDAAPASPSTPAVHVQVHAVRGDVCEPESKSAVQRPDGEKHAKEARNRARARGPLRREPSEPEVYRSHNRDKNVIRIRLRPTDSEEESERAPGEEAPGAPGSEEIAKAVAEPAARAGSPAHRPTALGGTGVVRKASFCSLFKASPVSMEGPRRKKSASEGGARSRSRERAASAGRLRGSVLALFKGPRRASAGGTRGDGPASPPHSVASTPTPTPARDHLRYYESAADVIHIPLRTPPEESPSALPVRPSSAPTAAPPPALPPGSILIPLHSPTERGPPPAPPEPEPPPCSPRSPPSHRRLMFSTQVGSGSSERVFATQLSLATTPSVTSDPSGSLTRDPRTAPDPSSPARTPGDPPDPSSPTRTPAVPSSPADAPSPLDSSSMSSDTLASEPPAAPVEPEGEARGLVVQDSFEELPYVPTTLPLERSLALPMVPVRERAHAHSHTASVQRPRGTCVPAGAPRAPPFTPPPAAAKLSVRLPPRTSSGPPAPWVAFEEGGPRRSPRRIQTLPPPAPQYAAPADCRCECHTLAVDDDRTSPGVGLGGLGGLGADDPPTLAVLMLMLLMLSSGRTRTTATGHSTPVSRS